jgi:hypothetical protein
MSTPAPPALTVYLLRPLTERSPLERLLVAIQVLSERVTVLPPHQSSQSLDSRGLRGPGWMSALPFDFVVDFDFT